MAELITEVDKDDNVLGLRPRDDFYSINSIIHRGAHLILFNSKNQILLQKRALDKKWSPGLYAYSVSGTVADESYEDCIKREMMEELGISIPVRYIFKHFVLDKNGKAFHAIFVGKTDLETIPDYSEMSEILWVPEDMLKKDIETHPEQYSFSFAEGMKKYWAWQKGK